jgi:DNA-binding CsgD family transcriptional regulator
MSQLDARVISGVYDAVLAPEQWPNALRGLSASMGAAGAAFIIRNKRRNLIDWACFVGPCEAQCGKYVDYYSKIDLFRPLIEASPEGKWHRLSRILCAPALRRSEWYNDFIVKSGIDDVMAIKLHDGPTHSLLLGFQQGAGVPLPRHGARMLRDIQQQLGRAARIQYQLRSLSWKSSMALRALDRLSVGVIFVDCESRVMEMTRAAERIVAADPGLIVHERRLSARRAFEAAKLNGLIAAAANEKHDAIAGRMVVARGDGAASCVLTVVPVDTRMTVSGRATAMILLVDPGAQSPSESILSEIYGLSPAESRLAGALMKGRTLDSVAAESGVRITTLRTQLSSVLRKVGVRRQADLVRVLSGIRIVE